MATGPHQATLKATLPHGINNKVEYNIHESCGHHMAAWPYGLKNRVYSCVMRLRARVRSV